MQRLWMVGFICAVALTFGACITHNPTRTFDEINHAMAPAPCGDVAFESTSIAGLQAQTEDGKRERERVGCTSEERHAASDAKEYPHRGFKLHVFEFDDDGVPWNRTRQQQSFEALRTQLNDKPAIVLVFVHGWKNDASVCNGNISCFREVLEILSKGESLFAGAGEPRQVIGVYIGWRGGTIETKGVKNLTFWGRKHTAHVIGDNGAVTATIERLRTIVATSEFRPTQSKTRLTRGPFRDTSLVIVGHSFGAALLFSAVATSLNARVGEAIQESFPAFEGTTLSTAQLQGVRPAISDRPITVDSSGDLIVLVNPAMEASRFAPLANTRNLIFNEEQVPIFMTLASEADSAVGAFFPVGQAFSTVSRAARSRDAWFRMDKGFGLYEPFLTHRVVARTDKPPTSHPKVSGTCRCTSNLGAYGNELIGELKPLYDQIRTLGPAALTKDSPEQRAAFQVLKLAAYQQMRYSRLEPVRDVDPNNPFVMATVDPTVVGGHSDIFNPRFMDFLIEYVIRSEIKRSLVGDYGPDPTQERRP